MDGDLQHNPKDILSLLKFLKKQNVTLLSVVEN